MRKTNFAVSFILALCFAAFQSAHAQGIPPNCPDSAGNHLNYTTATHAWGCGTTTSGSTLAAPVAKAHADSPFTISDAATAGIRTFLVNTSAGVLTINLPTNPVAGEIVYIKRTTTDGTTLTIGRNGKNIEGAAANLTDTNTTLVSYTLQYDSTSGSWYII